MAGYSEHQRPIWSRNICTKKRREMTPEIERRNREIVEMREAGHTYWEIERAFKLSSEQVHQIICGGKWKFQS